MQAANAEAFHLFLLSWSSTDQVAWHLHFPRTQKPRVFHYEWLLILSLTWEGEESRIESSVVFSVCKNSKLLTEVQAPDHLLAEWKKFIYFHWENFAAVLSGQFFSLKKKSIIFIYLVRCGILLVYLSALKFPTGTNTNPFSWLKRRGNWLTQTQLESHISSLLSHLVPCFKLTKAGSKSPAVQVDSPILIHFFNIQF